MRVFVEHARRVRAQVGEVASKLTGLCKNKVNKGKVKSR